MTIEQDILDKCRASIEEIGLMLSDENVRLERKQAFFMDSQEKMKKCMGALYGILENNKNNPSPTSEDEENSKEAELLINSLKNIISGFKDSMTINENISEEQATAVLNQETLSDALQTNETTKTIVNDLKQISQLSGGSKPPYGYTLSINGKMMMFQANTKDEIISSVNALVESVTEPITEIKLYQLSYKEIPLKQKTILSI